MCTIAQSYVRQCVIAHSLDRHCALPLRHCGVSRVSDNDAQVNAQWRRTDVCGAFTCALWRITYNVRHCASLLRHYNLYVIRHGAQVTAPHSYVRRHCTFICAPWRMHMRDMTPSYRRQNIDAFACAPWSIYTCNITHSCVRHRSFHVCTIVCFTCVAWLNHTDGSTMTRWYVHHLWYVHHRWYVHHISCIRVSLHISLGHIGVVHMCDMTQSYKRKLHDALIRAPSLMHMCTIAHFTCAPCRASHVWHGSIVQTAAPWLIDMCAMTHSYACYCTFHLCAMACFTCATWLIIQTAEPWLIDMCAMTHSYVCHCTYLLVHHGVVRTCDMTQSYRRAFSKERLHDTVDMSRVTLVNVSCQTHALVRDSFTYLTLNMWMNVWWHTYALVALNMWMSHNTREYMYVFIESRHLCVLCWLAMNTCMCSFMHKTRMYSVGYQ